MKKFLGALFLSLAVSHSALAGTNIPWTKEGCESVKGTWITAKSATDAGCDAAHCNGLSFCRSPQGMNWWSAVIWCQSIGHQLADIEVACPNGRSSGNTCANLSGILSGLVWFSTPVSNSGSYHWNPGISTYHSARTNTYQTAFCQE